MLTQKLILSFSSKIAVKLLQFIGTIIVARIAGATVLGTVAYGIAFVSVFGFIADLGTGTAHIKLVSDGNNNEANCNKTFLVLRLGLLFLFALTIALYYYIKHSFWGFNFPSETHKWVVLISFFTIIFSNAINIPITMFSSKIQQAKQDLPGILKTLINQSLRIAVVLLGYGAIAISLTNLFALLIVTPVYFYLARNFTLGNVDKALLVKYLNISIPLITVVAVNSYISFGDKLFLQNYSDSEHVGLYVAGYRLADFVLLIAGSVGLLFFPTFTKLISENNIHRINVIINKYERFSFSFILPFVVSLFIFRGFIVHLILGDDFLKSGEILAIITFALFIFTMVMPYGNIITAKSLFKSYAIINIIKAIVFTSMVIIFVSPYFGLGLKGLGMAWAVLITNIVFAIMLLLKSKSILNDLKLLQSKSIFFFAIAYSVLFFFIFKRFNLDISNLIGNLIFLVLFFSLFWLLGILFRVIKKDDYGLLLSLLDLSKMKDYIKNEISEKREE